MSRPVSKERLAVCTRGAGCFYYGGTADNPDIPDNVGRHLCCCVNGRYDSGANAKYIDELAECPCGKWPSVDKAPLETNQKGETR